MALMLMIMLITLTLQQCNNKALQGSNDLKSTNATFLGTVRKALFEVFFAMDLMISFSLAIYSVVLHTAIPTDSVPMSDSSLKNQVGDGGTGFFNEISKKIPDMNRFASSESFNRYQGTSIRRKATEGRPPGMSHLHDDPGYDGHSGMRDGDEQFGSQLMRKNRRYGGRERLIRDGSRNYFRDGEGSVVEGSDALVEDYPGEAMETSDDRLLDVPGRTYTKEMDIRRKKDHIWNGPVRHGAGKISLDGRKSFLQNEGDAGNGIGKDFLDGPPEVVTETATETRSRSFLRNSPAEGDAGMGKDLLKGQVVTETPNPSSQDPSDDPGKSVESSSIENAEPLLNVSEETISWEATELSGYTDRSGNVTEQVSDETSEDDPAISSSLAGETSAEGSGPVDRQEGPADVTTAMATKTSKSKTGFDNLPTIEKPSYATDYKLISARKGRRLEGFKAFHKGPRFRKTGSGREDGEKNSRFRGKMRNFMMRYPSLKNRGSFREDRVPHLNFDPSKKEKPENHSKLKYPSMNEDILKPVNKKEPAKIINTDLKITVNRPLKHQKPSPKNISESINNENISNPFKEHAKELHLKNTTIKQEAILDIDPNSLHKSKRFITEKRCRENAYRYIYIIAALGSLNAILLTTLGAFLFKIFRQPRKAQYVKLVSDFSIAPDNLNSKETSNLVYSNPDLSPSSVQGIANTSKQPSPQKIKSKVPVVKPNNAPVKNPYQRIRCVEMPSLETIPEVDETNISDHELRANNNFSLLSYKMEITRETNNKPIACGAKDPGPKHKNISYELRKISFNPPKVAAKEKRVSKKEIVETSLAKSPANDRVRKREAKINLTQTTANDRKANDDKSKNRRKNKINPRKTPGKSTDLQRNSAVAETNPHSEIHQAKSEKKESSKRNINDPLEKTSIDMKNKDEAVKSAHNITHSQIDYPKTLDPFDSTDHSNSEYDYSEVSNDSTEYSEEPFSDDHQSVEQPPSSRLETDKKVEQRTAAKTSRQHSNEDETDWKIPARKFSDDDVPASKRLMKLHRKIASKGFCGPTGSLLK